MMRKLVNDNMGNKFAQRDIAPCGPLVDDRPPEQPDHVRTHRLFRIGSFGDGAAFIEPGKFEGIGNLKRFKLLIGREFSDLESRLNGHARETAREATQRLMPPFLRIRPARERRRRACGPSIPILLQATQVDKRSIV